MPRTTPASCSTLTPTSRERSARKARIGHEKASVLSQQLHHATRRCVADYVEDDVAGYGRNLLVAQGRPDIFAHRLDVTGKLLPEHGLSWSAAAERQPNRHPNPGGEAESPPLAIGCADRRGADSNQHVVVLRNGLHHVSELKN